MKIANYILSSRPDRAPGDKVVDLAAWKAEHLMEPVGPETGGLTERCGAREPVRRRWTASDWAELAATLAVTAAFLALTLRVLL